MADQYGFWRLLAEGLRGHTGWKPAWRDPEPKAEYDVIIIGGGGHGLATAYYLAKNHGITNVAVLEKGYLGGGNVGRNTTIVRSNYLHTGNVLFYEKSLQLWEGLSNDLGYNVMFSPRSIINVFHSDSARDADTRRGNQMILHGADAVLLDREGIRREAPLVDVDNPRFPVYGGLKQTRAGSARHDAVAWGFARGADRRGVDLIQNCEVTGIDVRNGRVIGVQTNRGPIRAKKVGMAVAGNTSRVGKLAGLRLPIESHVLQAFVSEGLKPMLHNVITFGAGHFYISQSDKGGLVFGASLDGYNSYAQRGNLPRVEHVMEAAVSFVPAVSKVRMLRSWGGVMDMSPDGSPIIDKTPIEGLYLNAGWCYGGFKATPGSGWCFSHLIANDSPTHHIEQMRLDRFETGYVIDELGAGAQHNLH